MTDLVFCEPTELYNILNQVSKLSRLTEPNYLCLLDVRSRRQYDESHVITALRVKKKDKEYLIPESVDLECVKYCVVYDSNTSTLEMTLVNRDFEDDEDTDDLGPDPDHPLGTKSFASWDSAARMEMALGPAVECGKILSNFTRHPVHILKGGYERFSGLYHFFRTQKIIWMPQELDAFQPYPVEIIPGKIFLGNFSQACDPQVQKDLKIKAHINVSMELGPFFAGDPDNLLHIQIEDTPDTKIIPFLRHLCHFIEIHLELGSVLLVFSTRGISRSCAVIVAFLMHQNEETLKEVLLVGALPKDAILITLGQKSCAILGAVRSWAHVKKCKNNMRPNWGLVTQLSEWEKIVLGDVLTDIFDPMY